MNRQQRNRALGLAVLALGFWDIAPGWAAVTPGGDTTVAPTSSQGTIVGNVGIGTLTINAASVLNSYFGHIGYSAGSAGTATVSGTGSTWANSLHLYVGNSGSGMLRIEHGGQVSNGWGHIGSNDGSNGVVTVTKAGSTWTNDGTLVVGNSGRGTLNIQAGGQVSSGFCEIGRNSGSSGTASVSGAGSNWTNSNRLYVGYFGHGTLNIDAGGQVSSSYSRLGWSSDSTGTATVSGAGSRWTHTEDLYVGVSGSGTLTVETGGYVNSHFGYLGYNEGSSGTVVVSGPGASLNGALCIGVYGNGALAVRAGGQVSGVGILGMLSGSTGMTTVSGAGSKWTTAHLDIGGSGQGTLFVADGGQVTTQAMSINSQSAIGLHVSGNNMLVLGNASAAGSMRNYGAMSFYADPLLPAGTYRPISEYAGRSIIWSGPGSYKAIGGTWSNSGKTFNVLAPTSLPAGQSNTLTTGKRLLFTDSLTGQRVGASFGTIVGTVNFSAAPMAAADLADLAEVLDDGQGVLSAWTFTTNFTGGEAMLSFDIGPGAEDLAIWHYSNGVWSSFTPSLFTYDANGLASFTVSSFSGYALTAAVPEPASLGLLAFAGSILLARRRK